MSTICENFVQNAWRKDLCSNCFKQKQDHHICSNEDYIEEQEKTVFNNNTKLPSTWKGLALQKQLINTLVINGMTNGKSGLIETKYEKSETETVIPIGILKNGHRKSSTGSVGFREEEPQVIGYGGDLEFPSDDESDQLDECDSLENFDLEDEDKELTKLTERNTEFNSREENLLAMVSQVETTLVAKFNPNGESGEKEVICKPVEEEEQESSNRFQLPRATIRPFCRESVSSILDAKATTTAPEVHYDEHGHVVIKEMSCKVVDEREVVAYEVSPISKLAPIELESIFAASDTPPELPTSPPPDEFEKEEIHYSSSCVVFQNDNSQVKIKPVVPSKPKKEEVVVVVDDDEEIYQDTGESFQDLSFKDKIANMNCSLDLSKKSTKRPAPQPPQNGEEEKVESSNPLAVILRNPPVKRVSSVNCDIVEDNQPNSKPLSPPVPKKTFSYTSNVKVRTCHSLDVTSSRILSTPVADDGRKLKGKFSLKKLLKFGKDGEDNNKSKACSNVEKKMKLEIIHPMDLANLSSPTTPNGEWDSPMGGEAGTFTYLSEDKIISSTPNSPKSPTVGITRVKPPPPPRIKTENGGQMKPVRPPPPFKGATDSSTPVMTSPEMKEKNRMKIETNGADVSPSGGGEYANLGDVRIVLAPKKPERNSPASIRKENSEPLNEIKDTDKDMSPDRLYCEPPDSLVNSFIDDDASESSTLKASSPTIIKVSRHSRHVKAIGMVFPDSGFGETSSGDSDAGSVSSSEGQPPKVELNHLYAEVNKKEKSSKPRQMIPKLNSDDEAPPLPPVPPPLGETSDWENNSSDISGAGGGSCRGSSPELVTPKDEKWKKCWSLRPSCGGIRRNLEENYSAIVTANHEALAKLAEQVSSKKYTAVYDRLKDIALRWTDFKVESTVMAKLPNTAFYSAIWGSNLEVTLLVSDDIFPIPFPAKAPFLLSPIATFQDFIPTDFENETGSQEKLIHRMIWVFPPIKIETIQDFSTKLKILADDDIESFANLNIFLALQLITALKHLQSEGIEEVCYPPDWLVISGDETEDCTNLNLSLVNGSTNTFPHSDSNSFSLCASALIILKFLLTGDEKSNYENVCQFMPELVKTIFRVIIGMLENEKANSLSQVKAILEFALYGPAFDTKYHESNLQRWLDLEKAFALNNLIVRKELTVYEEFHVRFLTKTNCRILKEAITSLSCSKA